MKLKNYMEDAVFNYIDGLIKKLGSCNCPRCRIDIAALALNRLKPHYVATEEGEVYKKSMILLAQFEADVTTVLIDCIETVKRTPKH